MDKFQKQVSEFNIKINVKRSNSPVILSKEIKDKFELNKAIDLIKEEYHELMQAYYKDNTIEVIDGVCDLLYVLNGLMCRMGYDLEPFLQEVHENNILKILNGKLNDDGKWVKPKNHPAPKIQKLIEDQIRENNYNKITLVFNNINNKKESGIVKIKDVPFIKDISIPFIEIFDCKLDFYNCYVIVSENVFKYLHNNFGENHNYIRPYKITYNYKRAFIINLNIIEWVGSKTYLPKGISEDEFMKMEERLNVVYES